MVGYRGPRVDGYDCGGWEGQCVGGQDCGGDPGGGWIRGGGVQGWVDMGCRGGRSLGWMGNGYKVMVCREWVGIGGSRGGGYSVFDIQRVGRHGDAGVGGVKGCVGMGWWGTHRGG